MGSSVGLNVVPTLDLLPMSTFLKPLLSAFSALAFTVATSAQSTCIIDGQLFPPLSWGITGTQSLSQYRPLYELGPNHLVPGTLDGIPPSIKTIRCVINVWQDGYGNGNLIDTEENRDFLYEVFNGLTGINYNLGNLALPSQPVSIYSQLPYYELFTDSYIRFDLQQINFIPDASGQWYGMSSCNIEDIRAMIEAANNVHEECRGMMHFNLVGNFPCAGTGATAPPLFNRMDDLAHTGVKSHNWIGGAMTPAFVTHLINNWSHEIGHALHLGHTYSATVSAGPVCVENDGTTFSGQEGCNLTIQNCAGILTDVFESGGPCEHPGYSTNNWMGAGGPPYFLSGLQLARMHRTLMLSNNAKYTYGGYHPTPYVIPFSHVFERPVKFYEDVVIPKGVTVYSEM